MKLYTEEEIKRLLGKQIIFDENDLDKLTPIELPSDEEIDTASLMISKDRKEFLMGAKYLINKIQGGNK